MGKAQAARLKAALEMGRRVLARVPEDRWQIRAPDDAMNWLMGRMSHLTREHFMVIYLDTRNRILDHEMLYKGTLNMSLVRAAEVFRGAMIRNCMAIIVAHNHPSGDPQPSPEDIELTRRLVATGKLVEIDLLDHIIIGQQRHISLRERQLGFEEA